jgi:hypothetical protein
MNRDRTTERARNDSGEATLQWVAIAGAIVIAGIIVATFLMNKARHHGTALLPTLPALAITVGVMIGLAACMWAVSVVGIKLHDRRIAQARRLWEPRLRTWFALPAESTLQDYEIEQWLREHRRGLTVDIAAEWAHEGFAPTLAAAAPGKNIGIEPVKALAAVMAEARAWDGTDRRRLNDIIGWHIDIPIGPQYPVLHRWLAFPLPLVAERVAAAVEQAPVTWRSARPEYKASLAAEHALYELEQQATSAQRPSPSGE